MSRYDNLRNLRTIIAAKNAIRESQIAEDLGEQYVQDRIRKQTAPITSAVNDSNKKSIENLDNQVAKLRNDLNNVNLNIAALPAAMPTPQLIAPTPPPQITSAPSSSTPWTSRPPTSGPSASAPQTPPSASAPQTPPPSQGTVTIKKSIDKTFDDHVIMAPDEYKPYTNLRIMKTAQVDQNYGPIYSITVPTKTFSGQPASLETKYMAYDKANNKLLLKWFDGQDYSLDATPGLVFLLGASSYSLQDKVSDMINLGFITQKDLDTYTNLLNKAADKKSNVNPTTINAREKSLDKIKAALSASQSGSQNKPKPRTRSSSLGGNQSAAGIKKSLRTIYTGKAPAKTQSGSGIKYARGQDDKTRFEVMGGSIAGGNNNPDLKNSFLELADELYEKKKIKKSEHKNAYKIAGVPF